MTMRRAITALELMVGGTALFALGIYLIHGLFMMF
jgi:hypothetical protein